MAGKDKMNLEIFKVVCKAFSQSDNLDGMANHFVQLLVGAMEIKGSTIFILDDETKELIRLASFGLSPDYLNKGPVMADSGICALIEKKPIIVRDINVDDRLEYPDEAREEGIGAIVSICIPFQEHIIGGLRLYHHRPWDISDHDLDYLLIMVEHVGLAMMLARILGSLWSINEAMEDLPPELAPFLGREKQCLNETPFRHNEFLRVLWSLRDLRGETNLCPLWLYDKSVSVQYSADK